MGKPQPQRKAEPAAAAAAERRREAEAVLDALRRNEVDAVVGSRGVGLLRSCELEAQLRQSEARYRAIVEDQAELICRWTPDGVLTFANRAFARFAGRPCGELVGRPFTLDVPPDDAGRLAAHLAALGPEHQVACLEHRVRHGGRLRWLRRTDRALLDESGRVIEYQAVCQDVTERVEGERRMQALNDELEGLVAERTAELRRRASQLEELALELTEAEARERQNMAHLLHDHLQQLLVALRMRLESTRRRLPDVALQAEIEKAEALVVEAVEFTRTLTCDLSPPFMDRDGLPAALSWLAAWMRERHGLVVTVQTVAGVAPDQVPDPGDQRLRTFLFQAARELLFNVVKHSGAGEACLRLGVVAPDQIEMVVEDHGAGFELDTTAGRPSGYGLATIRERLELLGGSLDVAADPGAGTRVRLRCPTAGMGGGA